MAVFFDDKEVLKGPMEFEKEFSMEEFPLYIKEGAIVPMHIKREYTGLGDRESNGFTTILMYPEKNNSFKYYKPDTKEETTIAYQKNTQDLRITLEGTKIPHILRIHSAISPKEIILDDQKLDSTSWTYDGKEQKIIIKTNGNYEKGIYLIRF